MEATETSPLQAPAVPAPGPRFLARIIAWDLALLRWLAALVLPRFLSWPLIVLVRIGDGWVWCAVAVSLWLAMPLPQVKLVVAHCLVAIAISLALYWPIKLWVRRPRPHESGLGVTARVPPLDKYSFPSGHTMNNLTVALTLALYVPNTMLIAVAVPLLLGGLRILFGVHYLSDITGGALLGAVSFLLAQIVFLSF